MNRLKKVAQQIDNSPPGRFDTSYTAKEVHDDLEKGKVAGAYGGNHAAYLALSEVKQNIDLHATIKTNFENPLHNEDLDFLLTHPRVRSRWHEIVSFDPWGMYATRPTICGTKGCMRIDELRDVARDGTIVNEDGSINITKAAIDPVWNIKGLVKRLGLPEGELREALFRYTNNEQVKDPSVNIFLPNIGSTTLYFFGDLKKLADPATETAVRVHDECNGSDVFGTDICTCRPYLMFAIMGAVECAQRGGVGVVIYYRKEGRSLGEVTKFRVYNARKSQEGGDRPEMYFYATESIAGVRDARFQELMPDPLVWLGITRIDWLMSMSSDKYDAITAAGIQVMQRISLPDEMVPAGAGVEINAKIASGYHTDKIDAESIQQSLWNLALIRQRCQNVYDLALKDKLPYIRLNLEKLPDAVSLVVDAIKKNYPKLNIPHHSRWRHFQINGTDYLAQLAQKWRCDQIERARRLVDLTVISVLLDAGAGREWRYFDEQTGRQHPRSEGLAIATLHMFDDGVFSTDSAMPWRVNASALRRLEAKALSKGFQASDHNPMVGLEGRAAMINRLGQALQEHPEFFGEENPRPGNIVDYLLAHSKDKKVSMHHVWQVLSQGFESMWPARAGGVRRGDVWSHNSLKQMGRPGSDLVPFHKLLQWLAYSLVEPLAEVGLTVTDLNALTGLAEYRNGGLLIDTGVLQPKNQEAFKMMFDAGSEFVVEWRALTVVLLDKIAEGVRQYFGKTEEELPMSMILEGGTWRAGREIAARLRPTGESPITVRSDGTVF